MKVQLRLLVVLVGSVASATGCASYAPVPVHDLRSSKEEIKAAQTVGAAEDPEASHYLALAKAELSGARELLREGKNGRATWLLRRAEMDAELSIALARENWLRDEARQAVRLVNEVSSNGIPRSAP